MDSITQITLGAAVGEAVLGKKVGYKAALWGAALGTFPDLDILISPFVDSVSELYFHRGITHSFVFSAAISPLFGWGINRIHNQLDIGWKKWTNLVFWVIFTHILIDIPTTYGTQALQPFSNYPVTLDSIFIIDPFFTLPLLIGLLVSLFLQRSSNVRLHINRVGLFISTLYLLCGLGIKAHVHSVFEESFQEQYGNIEKIKTTPAGPTTFLWNGYIIQNDTLYHSLYSIFDDTTNLEFKSIPRNSNLIKQFEGDRAYEALMWFSRTYYTVEETAHGKIIIYDLRFGRSDLWLTNEAEYLWGNQLILSENRSAVNFEQKPTSFNISGDIFKKYWNRIFSQ
ncbi:MAG: metal-dependent hydrolase [Balneolaceae bacterium]